MILTKKKEDEFLNLIVGSLRPDNSLTRLAEINRKLLSELVSYLTKLKKEGVIEDKQFSELVILACSNFIENEVEARISKSLSNKVLHFFEAI